MGVGCRLTLRGCGRLACALSLLMVVTAAPALAAGEGLPRTYQVQRLDSPVPAAGGNLGQGMASAGDVNGDGEDDFLLPQLAGSPGADGQVFVRGNPAVERHG